MLFGATALNGESRAQSASPPPTMNSPCVPLAHISTVSCRSDGTAVECVLRWSHLGGPTGVCPASKSGWRLPWIKHRSQPAPTTLASFNPPSMGVPRSAVGIAWSRWFVTTVEAPIEDRDAHEARHVAKSGLIKVRTLPTGAGGAPAHRWCSRRNHRLAVPVLASSTIAKSVAAHRSGAGSRHKRPVIR